MILKIIQNFELKYFETAASASLHLKIFYTTKEQFSPIQNG